MADAFRKSLAADILQLARMNHMIRCKSKKAKCHKNRKGIVSEKEKDRVDSLNLRRGPDFLADFAVVEKSARDLRAALLVLSNMNRFKVHVRKFGLQEKKIGTHPKKTRLFLLRKISR